MWVCIIIIMVAYGILLLAIILLIIPSDAARSFKRSTQIHEWFDDEKNTTTIGLLKASAEHLGGAICRVPAGGGEICNEVCDL